MMPDYKLHCLNCNQITHMPELIERMTCYRSGFVHSLPFDLWEAMEGESHRVIPPLDRKKFMEDEE